MSGDGGKSATWLGLQVSGKARPHRSAAARHHRTQRFSRLHPRLSFAFLIGLFALFAVIGVARIVLVSSTASPGSGTGVLSGIACAAALVAAIVLSGRREPSAVGTSSPFLAACFLYLASFFAMLLWPVSVTQSALVSAVQSGAAAFFISLNAAFVAFLVVAVIPARLKGRSFSAAPVRSIVHITRARHWLDAARHPIPQEEWERFANGRGDFDKIDYTRLADSVTLSDPKITKSKTWPQIRDHFWRLSDYSHLCSDGTRVNLSWQGGEIRVEEVTSEQAASEIAAIAVALDANLMGEDGERYSLPPAASG